jgi:hypothetical protein
LGFSIRILFMLEFSLEMVDVDEMEDRVDSGDTDEG